VAVLAGGVLLACGALLAAAPAASVHIGAAGGSGPTNWSSEIVSVSPAMPGVTLRLPSGGDRLELVLAPDDPGVRLRRRAVPAHHTVHSGHQPAQCRHVHQRHG